jgi:hypothetical protein
MDCDGRDVLRGCGRVSDLEIAALSQMVHAGIAGIDHALIFVTLHYGLRYGFAPATGNFQRLRGRPPLVSPLKL